MSETHPRSIRNHFLQRRWFMVAFIVGSLLTIINNFDFILAQNWQAISPLKVLLTYCVPYLVSSISAWRALKNPDA